MIQTQALWRLHNVLQANMSLVWCSYWSIHQSIHAITPQLHILISAVKQIDIAENTGKIFTLISQMFYLDIIMYGIYTVAGVCRRFE